MKLTRLRLIALFLLIMVSVTSCAQVIDLTEEEEEKIALYSAGVIAKFNRSQSIGVVPVVMTPDKSKVEEETTQEEDSDNPQPMTNGGGSNGDVSSGGAGSLTDILGIPAISFSYGGVQVMETYMTDGFALTPRSDSSRYLVLTFTAKNTSDATVDCNIASRSPSFSVSINGATANVERTIIDNDFTTFNEPLGPGESRDMVMLFELPAEAVADTTGLSIIATKDNVRHQVTL